MWYQVNESNRVCGLRYTDPPEQDVDIWSWINEDIPEDFQNYLVVNDILIYDPLPVPIEQASPVEVIGAILEVMPSVVDSLPDELLEHMDSYFPKWLVDTDYYIDNIVSYDSILYRCLQFHTSQTGWEPDVVKSLWAKLLTDPSGEILPWVQPDSTNPYMRGDKVTHNGSIWVSDIDNNVWEPGVYGWTIDE